MDKSTVFLILLPGSESFLLVGRLPDDALITAGKVRDMNEGGRLRPVPNGEVIRFLDE